MNVEVIPMHTSGIEIPKPQAASNQPRTPFSFQRFLIPQLAGYRGRAIYLDSDMQVFSDMRELWSFDISEHQILTVLPAARSDRKPQYSVMLLNCDRLQWDINDIVKTLDQGQLDYEDLMYYMRIAPSQLASIPAEWNSLERYVEGKTKLVHYTDMDTQPWIYARHPLGHLWVGCLLEAIESGFISRDYVIEHIQKGWARPSLRYQIENNINDALLLPGYVLDRDKNYSPPYHKLPKHSARPWNSAVSYVKAVVRHCFYNSPIVGYLRRAKRRLSW